MINKLLLSTALACFFTMSQFSFSQSDGCTGVPSITPGGSCVTTAYNLPGSFSNGGLANASCATNNDRDDGWFSFTATATTTTITATAVSESVCLAIWSACGSGGTELACNQMSAGGTGTVSIPTTIGTTYYIQLHRRSGNGSASASGTLCVVNGVSATAFDEPCGAQPLPVNISCSYSTYSNASATASAGVPAPGCANYAGGDVWFTIVVPASGSFTIDTQPGVMTDSGMALYTGTCGALTLLECDDDDSANGLMSSITRSGMTPGTTVWIRVWEFGNDNNGTFGICATLPPPPPTNDNCNNAIVATMSSGSCSNTPGYITGATASSQANGCGGTANDDVWFSFVATANNAVINLTNVTGTTTDLYHSVYAGSCGAPGTALVCSDPNSSSVSGLVIGNTYYVRVYSWSSSSGLSSSFDLCILATGPCGTPNNQDYCVAPAILTEGPGSFSANTSGSYTSDIPANLGSIFCGSIENNSWYSFIATSTTHTFNFSNITNCNNNYGVQAQVYNVTQNANGCCTNFASQSNCYNPGTIASGTVTATGLTIGVEYYLMVDGNAGDVCSFTVTGWTATGIIPLSVELIDFNGVTLPDANLISWKTASELNNDFFEVQRTFDGVNFETIGTISGAGNSTKTNFYSFQDNSIRSGMVYYRLNQVDFDGNSFKTDLIKLDRLVTSEGLVAIYPNPTNDFLNVEMNDLSGTESKLEVISLNGIILHSEVIPTGYVTKSINLSNLKSGAYLIQLSNDKGGVSIKQFIKN